VTDDQDRSDVLRRLEWVFPAQAREAGEAGVAGAELRAVLDDQRGQMSIGCEVAGCAEWVEKLA
jgi:hypothetical protein